MVMMLVLVVVPRFSQVKNGHRGAFAVGACTSGEDPGLCATVGGKVRTH